MKHRTLAARIQRQERLRGHRRKRRAIYTVYDAADAAVTGYRAIGSEAVMRRPGEALTDLQTRALAESRSPVLLTLYQNSKQAGDAAGPEWSDGDEKFG